MYKVLLCWRYLKTRYLALACIISVMLGVATLIVVNSVMSGFSTKLRDRLHGLLSDVVIESPSMDGFADPDGKMARIKADPFLAEKIEALTPTMEVAAMLQFRLPNGEMFTKPVRVIGIDAESRGRIGGFKEHLCEPKNQVNPSFEVSGRALKRYQERTRFAVAPPPVQVPGEPPPPAPPDVEVKTPRGVIVGNLIANFRYKESAAPSSPVKEICVLKKGDPIVLTTVSGQRMSPVYDQFLVVDYFKSEMSEYDSNYVFVPLDHLQHLRTMHGRVTSIQLKLKDYREAPAVVEALRKIFPDPRQYRVETWEQKQSPLLQAIAIEKGILNVLLFLIVGVAGFGILAIFSMIVAEKTRDIGILKALGASNGGVMNIFLSYGLLLGLVGTTLGTGLGLWLTYNINGVEHFLSQVTGQEIFDRSVYYFNEIPTDVQPMSLLIVNVGAVLIAVLFSVLPALRAAWLHPVRALRYE